MTKRRTKVAAPKREMTAADWRELVAKASALGRPRIDGAAVFAPALHPPTVKGQTARPIAMDDAMASVNAWASSVLGSAYLEGQAFLGYPALAEMSLRPEYRAISETIARHMTRKWIEFQVVGATDEASRKDLAKKKADRIKKLTDFLDRLDVRGAFQTVAEQDGFFGRAHLYLDTGDDGDDEELLKPIGNGRNSLSRAKVTKEAPLKAVRPVEAVWCYPTDYDSQDPLKPTWYRPQTWTVMAKRLHVTRLPRFVGREVSDLLKPAYSFGGLSLTQMCRPYVENWLKVRQSVADLIQAFSVMVLETNLIDQMNVDQGQQIFLRAQFFNLMRQNAGLMMVDKAKEGFSNVSAPLSGLHELQSQAHEQLCSVSGIPVVELLGIQPSGLNATGEGEILTFEGKIAAAQVRLFRAHLSTIIWFAQLSEFGEIDPDIGWDFVPLRELTEKETAEIQKLKAEVDMTLVDAGALDGSDVRRRVADDPESDYHGIDPEAVPEEPELPVPIPGAPKAGAMKPVEQKAA